MFRNYLDFIFCVQGGEILQETLTSNVTSDTVMLEYLNSDGTLITQLIDFKRVIILI